jgi:hypothetical protein
VRLDLSPVFKSCAEKVLCLVKALSHHMTAMPLDYRGNREGSGRPPEAAPAIMHTVSMVGQKVLGLLQRYGPRG